MHSYTTESLPAAISFLVIVRALTPALAPISWPARRCAGVLFACLDPAPCDDLEAGRALSPVGGQPEAAGRGTRRKWDRDLLQISQGTAGGSSMVDPHTPQTWKSKCSPSISLAT